MAATSQAKQTQRVTGLVWNSPNTVAGEKYLDEVTDLCSGGL